MKVVYPQLGLGLVLALGLALGAAACAGEEEVTNASNTGGTSDAGKDAKPDAKPDAARDVEVPDAEGDGGDTDCVPKTCAQIDANCGTAPDGCGDVIECGECSDGQLCGGGGTNKCGFDACTPKSCMQVGAQCGWASDGCSEAIDCGSCVAPEICGGGGTINQCGCSPKTCAQLGANCGTLSDGCTGTLDCGSCTGGAVCGGGGPNVCGTSECVPKTCAQMGASCGTVSDGCSAALDCGSCTPPDVCGGSGVENQCGCSPKTCDQVGANCGIVDTGCGGVNCGECTPPDTCGGGGIENRCGCTCTLPNATTSCSGGVCLILSCNQGWADCDGVPDNGCESNLAADQSNCGACGVVCSPVNGGAACISGGCVITCDNGFANCDADPSNGCEAEFASDPDNCGGCGDACSDNHVPSPTCQNGACTGDCATGFADCNNDLRSDGCETNIGSNVDNCGGCGNVCSSNHVPAPQCTAGVCTGACEANFADCNANKLTDGCETNTTNDVSHCGSCGNDCEAPAPPNTSSVACTASTCEIVACSTNHYDQDQTYGTGCECAGDGIPNTCGSATALGTIGLSTIVKPSATTYYTLVPTGDRDWFKGTFQANANTCAQRPRITLQDSSGLLRMRVYDTQSCTALGGYTCKEGGDSADSTGFTSWSLGHAVTCGSNAPIDPSPATTGSYISHNTFLVEVFATGSSSGCLPYQLTFTRY